MKYYQETVNDERIFVAVLHGFWVGRSLIR